MTIALKLRTTFRPALVRNGESLLVPHTFQYVGTARILTLGARFPGGQIFSWFVVTRFDSDGPRSRMPDTDEAVLPAPMSRKPFLSLTGPPALCMQRPHEEKRQPILATAAMMFARHPFHKVRLDDIAAETHVGKGTLYEEPILF